MILRPALILTVSFLMLSACPGPSDSADTPVAGLTRLRADGTDLVDASGEPVLLRGVALGAWSFHETWISLLSYPEHGRLWLLAADHGIQPQVEEVLITLGPSGGDGWTEAFQQALAAEIGEEPAAALLTDAQSYPSTWDDSDLMMRLVLEERFGTDGRDALLDTFQRAWVREEHIAWLAEQGMNVVRVPLGYRGLTSGSDAEPLRDLVWNELAFDRLEELLDWCEAHGLYAVIDVQEAPGGQNAYSGSSTLYEDPAMQALTVRMWEELSDRFADRDVVAAYSLLAEPMSAPDSEARDAMYDQLVQAIRARGDDHLLVIHDGFRGMASLPRPEDMGWDGVIYSTHLFEWGAESAEDYDAYLTLWENGFEHTQGEHGVPYYIGSYSTFAHADYAYQAARDMRELFERMGWSWTLWTFARIDDPIDLALWGEQSAWGLLGRLPEESGFDRPDIYRDERDTLETKLSGYADIGLEPNPDLLEALTD